MGRFPPPVKAPTIPPGAPRKRPEFKVTEHTPKQASIASIVYYDEQGNILANAPLSPYEIRFTKELTEEQYAAIKHTLAASSTSMPLFITPNEYLPARETLTLLLFEWVDSYNDPLADTSDLYKKTKFLLDSLPGPKGFK